MEYSVHNRELEQNYFEKSQNSCVLYARVSVHAHAWGISYARDYTVCMWIFVERWKKQKKKEFNIYIYKKKKKTLMYSTLGIMCINLRIR